jgi:hypothetical protein
MVSEESVSASMNKLVGAINQLTELVRTAAEEMHDQPNKALEDKLDMLIQQNGDLLKHNEQIVRQNDEIHSSLLLLLELNRQMLPMIEKNTKQGMPLPIPSLPRPSASQLPGPADDLFPDLGLAPELPRR